MPDDNSLAAHLARARSLRRGTPAEIAQRAREARTLLPCNCNAGEGTQHKSTCPVRNRERIAEYRQRKDKGQ